MIQGKNTFLTNPQNFHSCTVCNLAKYLPTFLCAFCRVKAINSVLFWEPENIVILSVCFLRKHVTSKVDNIIKIFT